MENNAVSFFHLDSIANKKKTIPTNETNDRTISDGRLNFRKMARIILIIFIIGTLLGTTIIFIRNLNKVHLVPGLPVRKTRKSQFTIRFSKQKIDGGEDDDENHLIKF